MWSAMRPAHGGRRQQAHTVERAFVHQQLQQPDEVAGGRGHAGTAGEALRRACDVEPLENPEVRVGGHRPRVTLRRAPWTMEGRIGHAERIEHQLVQRASSGFLVTRSMMWPSRSVAIEYSNDVSGRERERQGRRASAASRRRTCCRRGRCRARGSGTKRVGRKEEVGEAGAMRHQVVHGRLARRRDQLGRAVARRIALARDLEVLQLGKVDRNRRHHRSRLCSNSRSAAIVVISFVDDAIG